MRFLAPCAILMIMSTASAETVTGNSTADVPSASQSPSIQQATQSVALKLIDLLKLSTVTESEKSSISLKAVVVKALNEGKEMAEIRAATNQAVSEITKPAVIANAAEAAAPVATATDNAPIMNPAEVTQDPSTGKMMATVQPGESIFRLAQRVYGKENGDKYIQIFAANTDKIKDINVVVQGQVLVMP